jgi:hypothetical protein
MSENATNIDDVVARIRKLMTYANDGSASEAEFENAMGHARKLMEKFNLSESAVLLDDTKKEDLFKSVTTQTGYTRANVFDNFDKWLAQAPCIICDVRCYTSKKWRDPVTGESYVSDRTGRPQERELLIFYGLPKDCQIAIAMYHELLATMRAMVRFRFPNDWQQHFSSYCQGFVGRLIERAHAAKATGQQESSMTTAIVVRKDILLDRKREELGLVVGKGRRAKISSGAGFAAGRQDGGNVSLGSNQIRGKAQGRLE